MTYGAGTPRRGPKSLQPNDLRLHFLKFIHKKTPTLFSVGENEYEKKQ